MTTIPFGERRIGNGHPPIFVAELGTCQRGSVEIVL